MTFVFQVNGTTVTKKQFIQDRQKNRGHALRSHSNSTITVNHVVIAKRLIT